MTSYINAHSALETLRQAAAASVPASSSSSPAEPLDAASRDLSRYGPRVMLVGSTDAGKSTLSQILANYAVRAQRSPLLVDLDVGQNELAPPGCLAACQLQHTFDLDGGSLSFTAPNLSHAPLVYFYGHPSPATNEEVRMTLSM